MSYSKYADYHVSSRPSAKRTGACVNVIAREKGNGFYRVDATVKAGIPLTYFLDRWRKGIKVFEGRENNVNKETFEEKLKDSIASVVVTKNQKPTTSIREALENLSRIGLASLDRFNDLRLLRDKGIV